MKKLLSLLMFVPVVGFNQYTLIPDNNFESYLITYGLDTIPDGKVLTSNINTIQHIDVSYGGITDLTGIEDFTSLIQLECYENQLTNLDVSSCINLQFLDCETNFLTSLDLSQNTSLITLWCYENQLTNINVSSCVNLEDFEFDNNQLSSIDISSNTSLIHIDAWDNSLTSFDVSNHPVLESLQIHSNNLECLNLKNGNNTSLNELTIQNNPNLTCVQVDDSIYSANNWLPDPGIPGFSTDFNYDSTQFFSQNCNFSTSCFALSNDLEKLSLIHVYPNPTNNLLQIEVKNYIGTIHSELYDFSGKLVNFTNKNSISLLDYPTGIYFLKVVYGDTVMQIKVVKN